MISRDFEHAYESLVDLVGRISQGKIPQHALGEKVSEWEQADCHCAGTLAEAALKALRYELAKTGLEKGEGAVSADLRSLGRVEAALQASELREVPLPEQLRQAMPEGRGFRMGELQIVFEPSEGPPYGHLSVSYPTTGIRPSRSCFRLPVHPEDLLRTSGLWYRNPRSWKGCTPTPFTSTRCHPRSYWDERARHTRNRP